ncbi:MAG: flagellar hook protein FlgE [Parvibaculum sp.]|jgi:flagellar hook protein FlgE|uniref:flagellar hook protein FlgE n=1 Tax=Parvibaculum sp. TaxID=2024848 RepID=UPI0028506129|nr:flagellar hook protein FlgE [Parvibaculum sp.]MDR3500557.1 flagellar hook protein FlgE [Parvibaculum sp.]
MSFFGSMTTAITGISAQSSALGYIADNIANSQTTGFKRTDASFYDIVTASSSTFSQPGAVIAKPSYTNNVQGSVDASQVSTNMAINGDGFFIVSQRVATADNNPVFQNVNYYTRRGDFTMDSNGYLVNGGGYYLQGLAIDPVTNNPIGGTPTVMQVNNSFLNAKATATITYTANLPSYPQTANSQTTVPGSELLETAAEAASATPPFHNNPAGTGAGNGIVQAQDSQAFLDRSVTGGAITAYDAQGNPVNVQLRWAKTDNAAGDGGTTAGDTWHLFYQSDSNATGTAAQWTDVGQAYTFNAQGQMSPAVTSTTISNLTVNNVNLGNVTLYHGAGNVTEFANPNGTVTVNSINQDGYASGQLNSVSVSTNGRVTGTYTNGKTIDLFQISLAKFNNPDGLQKMSGTAFAATQESGQPIVGGATGSVTPQALEASNVDLSDEFSKLIIAQQAYTAGTRIITTSDQLIQETLNMKH